MTVISKPRLFPTTHYVGCSRIGWRLSRYTHTHTHTPIFLHTHRRPSLSSHSSGDPSPRSELYPELSGSLPLNQSVFHFTLPIPLSLSPLFLPASLTTLSPCLSLPSISLPLSPHYRPYSLSPPPHARHFTILYSHISSFFFNPPPPHSISPSSPPFPSPLPLFTQPHFTAAQ